MSWHLTGLVSKKIIGSAARRLVLLSMADKANDDGSGVYASFATLAEMCEMSRPTVKRIVAQFEGEGLIRQVGIRPCRNGHTNDYSIVVAAVAAMPNLGDKGNPVHGEPGSQQPGNPVHGEPPTRVTMTPKPILKPIPKPSILSETPVSDGLGAEKKPMSSGGDNGSKSCLQKAVGGASKRKRPAYTPEFEALWTSWPKARRTLSDKSKAFERWRGALEQWDADTIQAAADRYLATKDVRKENYRYCCLAEVFLNGKLEAAVEAVTGAIMEPKRRIWNESLMAFVEEGA